MSKNYDVTIKWHTEADATVRETVVKTWASSPKLADKIGLRGARLDGTVPKDAIIDAPTVEPLRAVEAGDDKTPLQAEIDKQVDLEEQQASPGAIQIKTLDDLKRAIDMPGLVISVVAHWDAKEVGTTRTKMKGTLPAANSLRFNEDGTVTFYPKGRKSWTLGFAQGEAA